MKVCIDTTSIFFHTNLDFFVLLWMHSHRNFTLSSFIRKKVQAWPWISAVHCLFFFGIFRIRTTLGKQSMLSNLQKKNQWGGRDIFYIWHYVICTSVAINWVILVPLIKQCWLVLSPFQSIFTFSWSFLI